VNCLYLIRTSSNLPQEALDTFALASSELQRIRNLVQQFRETYRPSSFKPVDFDLVELISMVSTLLAPQLRQSNVHIQIYHEQDRILINGIPDQIQQVCLNICLNAIDAMEPMEGGQLDISVSSLEDQKKTQLSIHDTGPGIPKEIMSQIFEPFVTTKTNGTGLGLSICCEIVKNREGEIVMESQPGEGATFIIRLPSHRQ
jgi:signal transduction histidine kinase